MILRIEIDATVTVSLVEMYPPNTITAANTINVQLISAIKYPYICELVLKIKTRQVDTLIRICTHTKKPQAFNCFSSSTSLNHFKP